MLDDERDILCDFNNPNSRAVTFVFSEFLPVDKGVRSFSFRHMISGMNANVVYVKDRANQWYNRGVFGLGDDVADVATALKAIVTSNGFEEVRCLGTSMGGYASLLFGRELRAHAILAFAPQTFFAPPYPRFNEALHAGEYLDLAAFATLPAPRTRIILAQDELFDLYGALRLPYWREVDLQVIKTATHLVARVLNNAGSFKDILRDFVERGVFRECGVELSEIDFARLRDGLLTAVDAVYQRDHILAAGHFRTFVEAAPSWAGSYWWLGRALSARGNSRTAIECFEQALALNPSLYEAAGEVASIKLAQQDWAGALKYSMQGWQTNHTLLGARDKVIAQVLDATRNLIEKGRLGDGRALFRDLEDLFSRPDFGDHPLKDQVQAVGLVLRDRGLVGDILFSLPRRIKHALVSRKRNG